MATTNLSINPGDFDWFCAPLASMEDLSVVNTPIPTPTAGQSPRARARWSHRSSCGTMLDNMLGPINEMGEEDHEPERVCNDNNDQEDCLENGATESIPSLKLSTSLLFGNGDSFASENYPSATTQEIQEINGSTREPQPPNKL